MRFISPHRGYAINIRNPVQVPDKYGQMNEVEKGLVASFDISSSPKDWEIDQAEKSLDFRGMPVEEHTEEAIPVYLRLSVFDSEQAQIHNGWTDEERRVVEEKMLRLQHPQEFILSAKPAVPAPWPAYDTITIPVKIKKTVAELGYDPQTVIEYERDNANRPEVLAALEELLAEQAGGALETEDVVIRA